MLNTNTGNKVVCGNYELENDRNGESNLSDKKSMNLAKGGKKSSAIIK